MRTLLSGSVAFDSIMVFEDHFKNHILPDQIHILNVSFFVPTMKRHLGGCAGNMAYTLKLLGGDPVLMATVGEDFDPYAQWLSDHQIDMEFVKTLPGMFTAQAFITTDLDNNQINAFHPGAMSEAHQNKVTDAPDIEIGIVAPNGPQAMLDHATQFCEANIPFIFDPGQAMPLFDGEQLLNFVSQANWVIVNDYESQMLTTKTKTSLEELAAKVEALVVTLGPKGSRIYCDGKITDVPAAPVVKVADPTGCGDAYRAGVLFGLGQGLDWVTCARIGSVCGAIKVEQEGTQSHAFTPDQFAERYTAAYGETFS